MNHTLYDRKILFIGAGSMAEAILRGLIKQEVANPKRITITNRSNKDKLRMLENQYGVSTLQDPDQIKACAAESDIIVLAMKPIDAPKAILTYRSIFHEKQLLVSVIAGLSTQVIHSLLDNDQIPIARTMPNTSSSIGLGMTGISFSSNTQDVHRSLTQEMFQAIGQVLQTDEDQLHIVTGISGSGPAYIYYMMEAFVAGGMRGGLTQAEALDLTVSTMLGAASMVRQTGVDPATLRKKVTSPNGTTQAALEKLDSYLFTEAVENAVLRCAERSKEIAKGIEALAKELLENKA
ncbi:MAG: pyrroline-5-carboxylate reductase [Gorillibacterium sp.]|nr:pyrroline-5-carboxylate reductase [Gorillibacterium sp.]